MNRFLEVFNEPPEESQRISIRAYALMEDTRALLEAIRDGTVTTGQPRLVANLNSVVSELQETGHGGLAFNGVALIGFLSKSGLSAENCDLSRRPHPSLERPLAGQTP